ncbi:MAG: outer membrane protein assembly factor BamA [Betaproteobacteria bacterium]|nr:outer membrane protein assembly factor BamA [Betaproteobacteria bacterium]
MRFLRLLLLSALLIGCRLVHALEPFVVKDIRVEGIQRTEAGTIFSYLPIKVGETLTEERAAAAIRALYATGFFRDVVLEAENGVLIVTVLERPSIAQVDFTGVREFEPDQLKTGLKQVGLAEGRIFDRSLLERAEQELKRQYVSRGKYAATVTTTITPLERNRVSINFAVEEGEVAKIRQISVIGAKAFAEKELLSQFVLRTPGLMTWFSKHDQYSRQKLQADLESLRSFYLNRGYLGFNIDSTQVSITPDKTDVYITVGLTEGEKFTVSDVRLAGELLLPEAELRKLITIKPGDVFSRELLTESTKAISDRLGNDGYAFANVNAAPEVSREKRQVAFTFFVDPGRRVYVRRINVIGNTKTRDEVIRREMRQLEGAWYSAERVANSRNRLDRLGYFDDVAVETPSVSGTTDQIDVNISVKEKPTGNLLVGAGFSSSEGLVLSGGVTQTNVFGSGNHLGLQLNTSKVNTVYSLSLTEPYFTVDGVSRGFDIYKRDIDPTEIDSGRWRTSTIGAQLRFGVPISDLDTINYGIGVERTELNVFSDSPQRFIDFVDTFGETNSTLLGTIGWSRDNRDSLIYPTKGRMQRLSLESGLPGGSLRYYKLSYQHQWYWPLTRYYTLMLNGEIGIGDGLDDKPLPFFKNFFAGGVSSVRGYDANSLGPKDQFGDPIGGSKRVVLNAEFFIPFPGLENDRSVRLSAFTDAGMIADKFSGDEFRSSVGVAVLWVSPLGPLKISVAQPMSDKSGDKKQRFQFTFGASF